MSSTRLQWVMAGAQLLALLFLAKLIRSNKMFSQQIEDLKKAVEDETVAVQHVSDAVTAEGARVTQAITDLQNSPVADNPVIAQVITALQTSKTNLDTIASAADSIVPATPAG